MKQNAFGYVLLVILVIILLMPIQGMAAESDKPVLSLDTEHAIKDAYRKYVDEPDILDQEVTVTYYGAYDGVHIAFVDCARFNDIQVETEEIVGSYAFLYSSSRTLLAYRDGELMKLPKAWKAGWLTEEAVARLYHYYNGGAYVPNTGDWTVIPAMVMLLSGTALVLTVHRKKKIA